MPSPTLPSCLKEVRSFPILLTQHKKEEVLARFEALLEEWEEKNSEEYRRLDRLITEFYQQNPYMAWTKRDWRDYQHPEEGRRHVSMVWEERPGQRWSWWAWRSKHGAVGGGDRSWVHVPADYPLFREAYPEWGAEWEMRIASAPKVSAAEDEFHDVEQMSYNKAWYFWKESDQEWIAERLKSLYHYDHCREKGHKCDYCPIAEEAERRFQERDRILRQEQEAKEAERLRKEREAAEEYARQEREWEAKIQQEHKARAEQIRTRPVLHLPCETCRVSFGSQQALDHHNHSRDHILRVAEQNKEKYYCEVCKVQCRNEEHWNIHIASKKHTSKNDPETFVCECCDYQTPYKQTYQRHLQSRGHKAKVEAN